MAFARAGSSSCCSSRAEAVLVARARSRSSTPSAASSLFNHGTIVPVVYPLIALGFGGRRARRPSTVTAAFERERMRDVVLALRARGGGRPGAGADRRRRCASAASARSATVLFTDLRGFTTLRRDAAAPTSVIGVLNRYLSEMSDVILDNGGTLVAYMGDGIMAVFGAPIEQDDHADRALAAAREMTRGRLPQFNEWLRDQGVERRLPDGRRPQQRRGHVRQRRLASAASSTRRSATRRTPPSRLEGMTKGTPYMVFISGTTVKMAQDPPDDLVSVDRMEVRGRRERVDVWALPDPAGRSLRRRRERVTRRHDVTAVGGEVADERPCRG